MTIGLGVYTWYNLSFWLVVATLAMASATPYVIMGAVAGKVLNSDKI